MALAPGHQRHGHLSQIFVVFCVCCYFQWFWLLSVAKLRFLWLLLFFSMVRSDTRVCLKRDTQFKLLCSTQEFELGTPKS